MSDVETKLTHAYVRLLSHPETVPFAGVMHYGKRELRDDIPTACTNGIDVMYGTKFVESLSLPEVGGLIMHETLHKVFKHCHRNRELWKENPRLANMAADYVVNLVVDSIEDKSVAVLPPRALLDPAFAGWSFAEVYQALKQEEESGNGGNSKRQGQVIDEHDLSAADELTEEQLQTIEADINDALEQGGIHAAKLGKSLPRSIRQSMQPKVDWSRELAEFVAANKQGSDDDYTHSKYNRKYMAYDIVVPGTINETMGEIVIANDTSGSIDEDTLDRYAAELAALCESLNPERVRVLWWDTAVHGEQVFEPGDYPNIRNMLKPKGSGGTRVTSVSEYLVERKASPECVVVLTDGYVESEVEWQVGAPTVWLLAGSVTNRNFMPPAGRLIKMAA
jgi:predicted metal-dependent peptidase